jgi:hypothetical protein
MKASTNEEARRLSRIEANSGLGQEQPNTQNGEDED